MCVWQVVDTQWFLFFRCRSMGLTWRQSRLLLLLLSLSFFDYTFPSILYVLASLLCLLLSISLLFSTSSFFTSSSLYSSSHMLLNSPTYSTCMSCVLSIMHSFSSVSFPFTCHFHVFQLSLLSFFSYSSPSHSSSSSSNSSSTLGFVCLFSLGSSTERVECWDRLSRNGENTGGGEEEEGRMSTWRKARKSWECDIWANRLLANIVQSTTAVDLIYSFVFVDRWTSLGGEEIRKHTDTGRGREERQTDRLKTASKWYC